LHEIGASKMEFFRSAILLASHNDRTTTLFSVKTIHLKVTQAMRDDAMTAKLCSCL
jgi:hypothetical protein